MDLNALFESLTTSADGTVRPLLTAWLVQVGALLPRLLVAIAIVVAGLVVGRIARNAVTAGARAGRLARADLLGRAAQFVVVASAVVTGIDQVGVDSRFLTAIVTIVLGSALGGTALAFAFGARTEVSNLVAMHYIRQVHRPGQLIRLGDVQGRIREFTKTKVIVALDDGEAHLPARLFSDQVARVPAAQADSDQA
ncbi:MAG: hypothetical protein F4W89_01035 [Acidobacteria bacterium]|nr:hypothetical protein [Acidobacteriota bacterium]